MGVWLDKAENGPTRVSVVMSPFTYSLTGGSRLFLELFLSVPVDSLGLQVSHS